MTQLTLFEATIDKPSYTITPRDYQHEALEESFRLWDNGIEGVLLRIFTGGGKTICASMLADRWLKEDVRNKVMVISYEKELVWQFAQEVQDVLRITPGIEMEGEHVEPGSETRLVVASRQTLAKHRLTSPEQLEQLHEIGLSDEDLRLCTFLQAKTLLRWSRKKIHGLDTMRAQLLEWNQDYKCNHKVGAVSRLFKFNNEDHWLVIWDEAHKHAYQLQTVGHIVDWFRANPRHRDLGMTATPKRSDGVSIGFKMFPGIAIDYPLWTPRGRCAVRDGYAVPYRQKYIEVEGIDFKDIKALCGEDQSKWDAEMAKQLETKLTKVCGPMLEKVDDRRTLIFSPSVEMAQNVAHYINARAKVTCECGKVQWVESIEGSTAGAQCIQCGVMVATVATSDSIQAKAVWGEVPAKDRRDIYEGHQSGAFQFLSVCGLCREGYNDPDISCVSIFRPVSRAASSLGEQMKGRGSRPMRGLLDRLSTATERLAAIAASSKPDCLIIDLVGVTGLGDCATTVLIYAEGCPDEVVERAQEYLSDGLEDVQEAIEKAEEEIVREKAERKREHEERDRLAREKARERSKARAKARYTERDVGHGSTQHMPGSASDAQLRYLRFLGLEIVNRDVTPAHASRMIDHLERGDTPKRVAYSNGIIDEHFELAGPSRKQLAYLRHRGYQPFPGITPKQASEVIDRFKEGKARNGQSISDLLTKIDQAPTGRWLDEFARSCQMKRHMVTPQQWQILATAAARRRQQLGCER